MKIRQLEAFRAVMMAGTVTGAADVLHISQPVVSRLVAQLETSTGLRLFVRAKRRLQPTPEALALYQEIQKMFVGVERLRQFASDIRNFNTGRLRLISIPALAMGFLPLAIKRFLSKHPKVTVSLQTHSSQTVKEWISAQQFDIGLAAGHSDLPGVQSESFAEVDGVCILPRKHRLSRNRLIRAQDLENESFISLGLEDAVRHRVDRVFEEAGVARRLAVETQFAATVCGFVKLDLGVSIINPFTASDFENQGVVIRPFRPAVLFQYNLLYPAQHPPSVLALRFVDTLKACRDEISQKYQVR
ncbi:MAG: LysR family transcriptional regulator [Steroidobacteraceae bacterium]